MPPSLLQPVTEASAPTADPSRRVQAAAAAVAVALALDAGQESARAVPPPISPWQATFRGNVLSRPRRCVSAPTTSAKE